ncbi:MULTISPECIES: sensor histidine kinase [Frankia]|uniref:sensor histidine kinase n=1 Tax=Frankia TaxID=1854 RepID=UPI001F1FD05C|nr:MULTISPECIES: sensor histidine kinase [Frankia]
MTYDVPVHTGDGAAGAGRVYSRHSAAEVAVSGRVGSHGGDPRFAAPGCEVSHGSTLGSICGPVTGGSGADGIRHEAFLYQGDAGFLSATRDFVLAGLAVDEAVLVAVTQPRIRQLRAALGRAAQRVSFLDMAELGRNPARVIPAWQDFLDLGVERGRLVRGIGEPTWLARSGPERRESMLHEALLNEAFAAPPAWRLRCLYDVGRIGPALVDEIWRTHPAVVEGGLGRISSRYRPPGSAVASPGPDPLAEALPDLGVPRVEFAFGPRDLGHVRAEVIRVALAWGLGAERTGEFELAVHEVATNSVHHGGGHGAVRLWTDDACLICEVRDGGRLYDRLAGRRRPDLSLGGGRGLWLVNQLCDLVQLRSTRVGTTVRMYMYV